MLRNPAASGARQVSRTDSQLVAERRLLASAGATPLPPRPTLKSGPASFATTSVANLPPSLRGANRTFTVQVAPAAIAWPVQLCFRNTKFLGAAPFRCRPETVRSAAPVFLMITCLTLLMRPSARSGNDTDVGVAWMFGSSALPWSDTACVLPATDPSSSVKVTVAFEVPAVVGRNVIWALHEWLGWSCALPQSPVPALVKVASPVRVAPATSSTALPVLVSVTDLVCGTFRGVAKLTEASTEACGTAPLPVRLTTVAPALLAMDSTPVLAPALAGEKVTVMSQPPAGGTVPHPLLLTANSPVDPTVVSEADTVANTRSASPVFVMCTALSDEVVPTF